MELETKSKKYAGMSVIMKKTIMKIKFNSDDNLPLNKPLKSHLMTITIRSVFEEDGKLYAKVFLDDSLYELNIYKINSGSVFYNFAWEYIKMSEITDLTYYQKKPNCNTK